MKFSICWKCRPSFLGFISLRVSNGSELYIQYNIYIYVIYIYIHIFIMCIQIFILHTFLEMSWTRCCINVVSMFTRNAWCSV